jgi:hypothetical protein
MSSTNSPIELQFKPRDPESPRQSYRTLLLLNPQGGGTQFRIHFYANDSQEITTISFERLYPMPGTFASVEKRDDGPYILCPYNSSDPYKPLMCHITPDERYDSLRSFCAYLASD